MVETRAYLPTDVFRPAAIRLQHRPELWDTERFTVRLASFSGPLVEIDAESQRCERLSEVSWFKPWGAAQPIELVGTTRCVELMEDEKAGHRGPMILFDAADVRFELDRDFVRANPLETVAGALICEGSLRDPDPQPIVLVHSTGGFPFHARAAAPAVNVMWHRDGIFRFWTPGVFDYRRSVRFDRCACGETRTELVGDGELCSNCGRGRP